MGKSALALVKPLSYKAFVVCDRIFCEKNGNSAAQITSSIFNQLDTDRNGYITTSDFQQQVGSQQSGGQASDDGTSGSSRTIRRRPLNDLTAQAKITNFVSSKYGDQHPIIMDKWVDEKTSLGYYSYQWRKTIWLKQVRWQNIFSYDNNGTQVLQREMGFKEGHTIKQGSSQSFTVGAGADIKGVSLDFGFESKTFTEEQWSAEKTVKDTIKIGPGDNLIIYEKVYVLLCRIWLYKDEYGEMYGAASMQEIRIWLDQVQSKRIIVPGGFGGNVYSGMQFQENSVGLSEVEIYDNSSLWNVTSNPQKGLIADLPSGSQQIVFTGKEDESLLNTYGAGGRPRYSAP